MHVHDTTIEIFGATLELACLKKGRIFIQLISSTLFCEVERGFVDRRKIVPLKLITLSRGDISQFLLGVLSPKIFAGPVPTYLY
jgi:hypothetical protein